ncbi:MAG TPA: trypsin-like serine protease [Solirubrobacterales bacterium]|nr:trypsin-like serine protease [Solirubrobacterales bacterium]
MSVRLLTPAIVALALLLPATASAAEPTAHTSIVNGHGATVEEFPSLAYIEAHQGKTGFSCTGTVVAPRVILTAAHCIEDLERGGFTPAQQYAVATGTTTPSQALRQNVFKVLETHVYPGFDPGGLQGDAGVLILDRPTAAPPIAMAGSADAALYAGGAPVQLAGWGVTGANAKNAPESLRATSMKVLSPAVCTQKTRNDRPNYSAAVQMCTLDTPTKKSGGCFGDSGGPAIGVRPDGVPVELGVISTGGAFCSTKLPNVLTRVDVISGWVNEWIAATETGGPRPFVDPKTPFPLMTRPVAEEFTVLTMQARFGPRFSGRVFGRCRRASRSRFRCEVSWRSGRNIYAGIVSPFYLRQQDAVTWKSHFRIEWAPLKCLRSNAPNCPIRTARG